MYKNFLKEHVKPYIVADVKYDFYGQESVWKLNYKNAMRFRYQVYPACCGILLMHDFNVDMPLHLGELSALMITAYAHHSSRVELEKNIISLVCPSRGKCVDEDDIYWWIYNESMHLNGKVVDSFINKNSYNYNHVIHIPVEPDIWMDVLGYEIWTGNNEEEVEDYDDEEEI
jgi:hypothetical protein